MPRRKESSRQPKRLKQKSLEAFFPHSSSPIPPTSPVPGPSRPKKVQRSKKGTSSTPKKRGRAKQIPSDDESIPSEGDAANISSDPGKIRFEPEVVSVSSSEDEVALSSPRIPTRLQVKKRRKLAQSDENGEDEPISVSSDDSEEHIGIPVRWKGKASPAKRSRQIVGSDDEDDQPPRRRKLVKGVRPPTPEEEEDLLAEVDESKIIEPRLRSRDKRSVYLQNLEKLKKKKRGEAIQSDPSESEEEDEDADEDVEPFAGAKPDNDTHSGSDQDEREMDSWIVDDGDAVAPELPPEFSMNTYQDLVHHFKIICQLYVHLAVQRRKDRREFMERSLKDKYFGVPLQIARRKLEGMRDSLVTSSIWRPGFKKALNKFPELETVVLDFVVPGCDACHLGGRMSKLVGRLGGEPYDKVTFKPLKQDESDSDESEEGLSTTGSKTEFHLGRFCARRTRAYHRFTHWEYTLFKALSAEVDDLHNKEQGSRVFVRVAYVGGLKPPDDLTDADAIMNWLDERGVIAAEWQNVKEMMDSAQHLEIAAKRGDNED